MYKRLIPVLLIFVAAVLFLGSCGGGQQKQAAPAPEPPRETITQTKDLAPVEAPKIDQGLVTYLSGDVTYKKGDAWEILDIGQAVKQDDLIKTAKASSCEIQFGKATVVKIQENTEIAVKSLALQDAKTQVGLDMKVGSVLAKVQKLSGSDKFQVKTGSAVCGVRGTEFGVTADPVKGTTLAVKEGRVAVLPKSVDVDDFKDRAAAKGIKDANLDKALDKIEANATVVGKSQELVVDQAAVAKAEEKAKVIEQVVDRAAQDKQLNRGELQQIEKAVEESRQVAAQATEQPKQISTENEAKLKSIDKMKIVEIPVSLPVEKAKQEQAQPVIKLFKVAVEVDPVDAQISLNGDMVGIGKYSGIFKEGEKLSFVVEKQGFKPHSVEITAKEDSAKQYKFTLAALPQEKPKEPAKVSVTVNTKPDDASIFINNQAQGKGSYTAEYAVGTELAVKITREGYEDHSATVKVPESAGAPFAYELKQLMIRVTVRANPADASIYINNQLLGRGAQTADFAAGSDLAVKITRDGYEDYAGTIKVPNAAAAPYEYSLKQRLIAVTVRANPADAAIFINGQPQGRGAYNAELPAGAELAVKITRDGYEDLTAAIKVAEAAGPFEYALKPRLIENRVKLGGQRLVGAVSVDDGKLVVADRRGTLYALSTEGNVLWNLVTGNTPNENSFPTIVHNRVYFSGGKEFVIVNADNGAALHRAPLDTASSHLFGRRAVTSALGILFPVNNAVHVLDPDSGRQLKSIPIPGGSQMSPMTYKGNLLIADQQGTLLSINAGNGAIGFSGASSAIQPLSHPVVVIQEKAYFAGRKGSVACFDLEGKKLLWQRELNAKTPPVADIAAGEKAVYVYADQAIRALALSTGNDLFGAIRNASSAPLLVQGRLYFGRNDGLAVADAQTGRILATIKVPGGISARPAVADGKIYAASGDGDLVIINPRSVLR